MHSTIELNLGTEYRGVDGKTYVVISNFSQGTKIFVELQEVENEEEQLISEI